MPHEFPPDRSRTVQRHVPPPHRSVDVRADYVIAVRMEVQCIDGTPMPPETFADHTARGVPEPDHTVISATSKPPAGAVKPDPVRELAIAVQTMTEFPAAQIPDPGDRTVIRCRQ